MRDRIVLLGQAPSRTGDPQKPMTGRTGFRLAEMAGCETRIQKLRFLAFFERMDLIDRYTGPSGRGDSFPMEEARTKAVEVTRLMAGRRVLLVGRQVAKAFGVGDVDYFRWVSIGDMRCAVIPHLSGINQWWNDPFNQRRARLFLKAWSDAMD